MSILVPLKTSNLVPFYKALDMTWKPKNAHPNVWKYKDFQAAKRRLLDSWWAVELETRVENCFLN
jgi:hypothetical protein